MISRYRSAAPRRYVAEINVVPYIDVMLVLLVIFMVTAPLLTPGVAVDLPQTTSEPIPLDKQEEPLIISVDANGAYYLDLGGDPGQPMHLAQITEQVQKILVENPAVEVLVRGDRHTDYGTVVNLMAVLQDSGADRVGLITETP